MRIVGGAWRGTALAALGRGDAAAHLRPTADRVRESLFNILAHDGTTLIEGARVLDLFAGTGALGLEALSRGAAHATFVDRGRTALGLLGANVARLRAGERATVLAADATRLPKAPAAAALVFLDPPYGSGLGAPALAAAAAGGWIAPGATIVWEDAAAGTPPSGFARTDLRRYGAATVQFLRFEG